MQPSYQFSHSEFNLPKTATEAAQCLKVGSHSRKHSFTASGSGSSPVQLSFDGTPMAAPRPRPKVDSVVYKLKKEHDARRGADREDLLILKTHWACACYLVTATHKKQKS